MPKLLIGKRLRKRSFWVDQDEEQPVVDETPDLQLIRLVVQGDQEAFDRLYLRYKPKIARFIRNFIEDQATADDLLQETFLRVYQNAGKYDPDYRFSSWIYRIAANLCLNELRRRRTHPQLSLNQQVCIGITESESETVELHELIPDSCFIGPSEAAESAETLREIASAFETLSQAHREVVGMRLYDEMKYEQIAAVLKCSVGTAKSRAFYGLRVLRDKLETTDEPG